MQIKKIIVRKQWTESDNREVIALYNKMLDFQIQGIKYSKAPLVRALAEKQERSKSSIECRLMNITACYYQLGNPLGVTGYKALANFPKDLLTLVKEVA